MRQGQRPQPAAIGDHVPDVRALSVHAAQQGIQVCPARLPPAMVINQRTQRIEVDAEAGQQAQQGRFHDSRPVRDAFPGTHLDAGSDQAEGQMEKQFAPFLRRQSSLDPLIRRVLAEALDDGEA